MIDYSCALCGADANTTHPCGNDYMCDRCCINVMEAPEYLHNWFNNVVIPKSIQNKKSKNA